MDGKINKEKTVFFHLCLLELKVLPPPGVGIYVQMGPDPGIQAFQDELLKIMGKYRILRIDAIMVPCDREQKETITLEIKDTEKEQKDEQEEPEEDRNIGHSGPKR